MCSNGLYSLAIKIVAYKIQPGIRLRDGIVHLDQELPLEQLGRIRGRDIDADDRDPRLEIQDGIAYSILQIADHMRRQGIEEIRPEIAPVSRFHDPFSQCRR